MKNIDFYFDFLSPYSYFAWKNHIKLREKFKFNYLPILMGKLFDKHGIIGPGQIPAKRKLMLRSCFRYADRNNISFIPPQEHPFNPLYVLRLACRECSGDNQFQVIDTIWDYIWGNGLNADSPEQLVQFLNSRNLDGVTLLDKTSTSEVRAAIKLNTKQALSENLFGVPSFKVDNEIFWGNDSLEDISFYEANGIKFDEKLFNQRTEDINL